MFRDRVSRVGRVVLGVFGSRFVSCCACCGFRAARYACWACWLSLCLALFPFPWNRVFSVLRVARVSAMCMSLAQNGLETVPAARGSVSVHAWQGVLRNSVLRVACRVRPSLTYYSLLVMIQIRGPKRANIHKHVQRMRIQPFRDKRNDTVAT